MMAPARRINLFLMHMETGQRYPLTESEVVIGRSSGDIIYPEDSNLSHQHCRIFSSPEGVFIHDLNSQSGTLVDSKRIDSKKAYLLRPGMIIQVGDQSLRFQEAILARRHQHKKKSRRRKTIALDLASGLSLVLLAAAVIGFLINLIGMKRTREAQVAPQAIVSPYELVDKEVQSAFESYKQMGFSFKSGKIDNLQAAKLIRNQLLPKFGAVQIKLAVVKPVSEYDRQRMELNKKLITALSSQLEAFARFVESKDEKFAKEVEKFAAESETIREQLSMLKRDQH